MAKSRCRSTRTCWGMTYFSASFVAIRSSFFCQAADGIRDPLVTGVQTCALPIWRRHRLANHRPPCERAHDDREQVETDGDRDPPPFDGREGVADRVDAQSAPPEQREGTAHDDERERGAAGERPGRMD